MHPERLDARGGNEPTPSNPDVPTALYSSSGDIEVFAEIVDGVFTRVVPHGVFQLDNGARLDAFERLTPIAPLPAQKIDANTLYWVVMQGQQVGIFHTTW